MVLCQWDSYLNPPADFYGRYSLGRIILEQVLSKKVLWCDRCFCDSPYAREYFWVHSSLSINTRT